MAVKRPGCFAAEAACAQAKRTRLDKDASYAVTSRGSSRSLDSLPMDVLPIVLAALAEKATSPASFAAAAMTCTSMREASRKPEVLASLAPAALACSADSFSPAYHAFLRQCASAGNMEASFLLGMIEFYCLGNRKDGVKFLVRAAKSGHAEALYSLAVIHFNGSGSTVPERKLSVGVLLCASAAQQGHVQALRELGHCFQDGYGIKKNAAEGRRLLMEANLREFVAHHSSASQQQPGCSPAALEQVQKLEAVLQTVKSASPQMVVQGADPAAPSLERKDTSDRVESTAREEAELRDRVYSNDGASSSGHDGMDGASMAFLQSMCHCLQPLLNDCGSPAESGPSPVQAFLIRWHHLHGPTPDNAGLKRCAHAHCGRVETRSREFRCCALCSRPSYCSRACQSSDWRMGHMMDCQHQ